MYQHSDPESLWRTLRKRVLFPRIRAVFHFSVKTACTVRVAAKDWHCYLNTKGEAGSAFHGEDSNFQDLWTRASLFVRTWAWTFRGAQCPCPRSGSELLSLGTRRSHWCCRFPATCHLNREPGGDPGSCSQVTCSPGLLARGWFGKFLEFSSIARQCEAFPG